MDGLHDFDDFSAVGFVESTMYGRLGEDRRVSGPL